MLGAPLEVPVFKSSDGTSVVFSDRCLVRLDEGQFRDDLVTKIHFLRDVEVQVHVLEGRPLFGEVEIQRE
jgi:hypothetical protein